MGNGPENQGGAWQQAEPTEPPADLLRRALSHVEDLLGRLEYPAVKQGELESLADEQTGAALPGGAVATEDSTATAVVQVEPDLQQARGMARRIQDEARATADAILAQARRDAQLIRGQGRADAEQLAQEAALEAERTLAEAQTVAEQRVAAADAEGQRIRAASRADEHAAINAERVRTRELLDSAGNMILGIRTELRVLADTLSSSVNALESSGRALDALLASLSDDAGTPEAPGDPGNGTPDRGDALPSGAAVEREPIARPRGRDGDGPAVASHGGDPQGSPRARTADTERASDAGSRGRSPLGPLFGAGRR